MRTAIYFFYGLDVEIRPIWTPPELFIHLGGAIGIVVSMKQNVDPQNLKNMD